MHMINFFSLDPLTYTQNAYIIYIEHRETQNKKRKKMTFNPPHEIRDEKKLQAMIDTLNNGGSLPPIVVIGESALTGSHRLAAWLECDMDPDYIEITNDEYYKTMESLDLDPIYDNIDDYNQFCAALMEIVEDDAIKETLKDQI
jgi:hypothetical protein